MSTKIEQVNTLPRIQTIADKNVAGSSMLSCIVQTVRAGAKRANIDILHRTEQRILIGARYFCTCVPTGPPFRTTTHRIGFIS